MCTGQESCVVTFCLHLQVDSGEFLARNLAAKSRWFLNIWFWKKKLGFVLGFVLERILGCVLGFVLGLILGLEGFLES